MATDRVRPEATSGDAPATLVTIDLASLTLGEMAAVEEASGIPFDVILRRGSATRRLMALYVQALRTSDTPPSWHELGDLRPFGD